MSDGQLLLAALIAFTLLECARWVPSRAWIFQARGGGAWRGTRPWNLFRTRGGGVALLTPVPPVEAHIVTAAWPCAPHEKGLCVWDDNSGTARHVPWHQVKARAEGAVLQVTPELHTRRVNATSATAWAELVSAWVEQSPAQRTRSFLKKAGTMLDVEPCAMAAAALQNETRWLRRMGGWVFWWCFLGLPLTYWRFADLWPTFAVIAGLFMLMFTQAFLLWRLVRKNTTLRRDSLQHLLSAAVFPPASMRAADWVCSVKTPDAHPLAALKAWGTTEEFRRAAAECWRAARWPLGDFATLPWNGPEVEALASFLGTHDLDSACFEAPPPAQEGCTRWCPRCLVQYASPAVECADCAGMKLQDLASPA